ncbi:TetR/AcrR family transcriptional regulator [Nonomuraea gerenzanensis]|uniref:Transcriptional regulator, TetR family n=1 Tax=Nonomuraea gerenzanensis TaxID=93944 RepID=A0A1M4E5Q5_9ACTN|nr:TetR/AcrR family transcriptional regulator [Nonomuraea gerenzanensis]UBU16273.1 TetR/AcrR family transcriptional regulator [Nonomuraea gerenzanensis]SBO94088.1 Transcriptional regulator, TetR family [Nonomuraea gerenzanensis]
MSDGRKPNKKAQKAAETRRRVLGAAGDLFVAQGYGATTLQEIATRAGVAVQTVYFVFGNKRRLLKELVDVTIAGDDLPVATLDRPWFRAAMAAGTAEEHLRGHVTGTLGVLERVAPITKVLEVAAATDPEVSEMWPDEEDPRHVVATAAAVALMAKPGARPEVPVEEAADLLYGVLSPDLYLLFVRERGWAPERFGRWAYETLRAQLCVVTSVVPKT